MIKKNLTGPQRAVCGVTTWPSNCTPRYIPRRTENICSHKNSYTNVHSSIIHNNPKVKTTQLSTSGQMNWNSALQPYNGILFCPKKESGTASMGELWKQMLGRRIQTQKTIYSMTAFAWNIQNRQIHTENESGLGTPNHQGKGVQSDCTCAGAEFLFGVKNRLWQQSS